jgi:hypothetical protein
VTRICKIWIVDKIIGNFELKWPLLTAWLRG